jgi:hypothetical protein
MVDWERLKWGKKRRTGLSARINDSSIHASID